MSRRRQATKTAKSRTRKTEQKESSSRSRRSVIRTGKSFEKGEEAEAKVAEVRKKRRESGQDRVNRFFLKPGEEAEVIFLDQEHRDGVNFHEHQLKIGNGKGAWNNWFTCIREAETCPICVSGNDSYWVCYFSILHINAYEKDGEWKHVRKLFGVKWGHWQGTIKKLIAAAERKHGQLRGVALNLERPEEAQSAAIGEPVEFPDLGTRFDFYDEGDLEEYANEDIKNRAGKVVVPAGVNIQPFDYELLFPYPDASDLRAVVGGESVAGADEASDEWEEEEKEREKPKKGRDRSRRSRVSDEEVDEEEEENEEEDDIDYGDD